jgi:hypothetical protein
LRLNAIDKELRARKMAEQQKPLLSGLDQGVVAIERL